jgi:hypothetical protein
VLSDGGNPIAPAEAFRRLGYGADVAAMSAGGEKGEAKDCCMPLAARAMLQADTGFGKDS